ncbi:MAG: hypothetical protein KGZ37_03665 [Nitrosarchaeum sp.]|nr:hypothetical protein [Nitrosarchaeum sp.]
MFFDKKTRRGLSTIVTSAILLSAVAVMGVIVVTWANTNLVKHQQDLDSTVSTNYNKINEKILIEHVWFNQNGPVVNMTLNNIGTIGLNVTSVIITNVTSSQTYSFTHTNGGIFPNGTLSLTETFGWVTNTPYKILISTERNNQFETQVVSP